MKTKYLIPAIIALVLTGCNKDISCDYEYTVNGTTVTFDASKSKGATHFEWDFDDYPYERGTGKKVTHTYYNEGTFCVELNCSNKNGDHEFSDKYISISQGGGVTTKTASYAKITSLTLNTYPQYDGNSNWDFTDAGPDIYFKILNSSGSVVYTSSVKNDVTYKPEVNLYYGDINYTIYDLSKEYDIKFYDQDGALDNDDFMGGYYWIPIFDNDNYSSSVIFSSPSSDLSFTLNVIWYDENGKVIK